LTEARPHPPAAAGGVVALKGAMAGMARWNIDPAGVKSVIMKTGTHAEDLSAAVSSWATDMQNCASSLGESIVVKALSDFAEAQKPTLQFVGNRIKNAVSGTVDAVTFYIKGNIEMAQNAQTRASQIAPTVPPGRIRPN
jgi:Family of unknown function (DUF6507)